jgi:hypothetical protein
MKRRKKLVPPARFQRATSRLGGERSMQLSYGSKQAVNSIQQTADSKKASSHLTKTVTRSMSSGCLLFTDCCLLYV